MSILADFEADLPRLLWPVPRITFDLEWGVQKKLDGLLLFSIWGSSHHHTGRFVLQLSVVHDIHILGQIVLNRPDDCRLFLRTFLIFSDVGKLRNSFLFHDRLDLISYPLMHRHMFLFSKIFRAGWKLVVGSGNFQERRFITAVVPSADLGESGDGGRVVLEDSLAHHHRTGASAAIARPGRAEVAAYQKRQVDCRFFRHTCPQACSGYLSDRRLDRFCGKLA